RGSRICAGDRTCVGTSRRRRAPRRVLLALRGGAPRLTGIDRAEAPAISGPRRPTAGAARRFTAVARPGVWGGPVPRAAPGMGVAGARHGHLPAGRCDLRGTGYRCRPGDVARFPPDVRRRGPGGLERDPGRRTPSARVVAAAL